MEKNITQDDRKTGNETQECDLKIHEHNRNDDEHEQNKEDTKLKKKKMQNQKLKIMPRPYWQNSSQKIMSEKMK